MSGINILILLLGTKESKLYRHFKWVFRCSPRETKIDTPVCASCAETTRQPCRTRHSRCSVDETLMYIQAHVFVSGPAPGLLKWACFDQRWFYSIPADWSICSCMNEQTIVRFLTSCRMHRALHGTRLRMTKSNAGSTPLLPSSDPGSTASWSGKRIHGPSTVFISHGLDAFVTLYDHDKW